MNVETKIAEMVNDIESSESTVTIRLVSWPYSRKLVEGVCKHLGLEYEYVRVDKRFEEFSIQASESIESTLKEMIKLVNKQARESSNSTTKERNVIVDRTIAELNGDESEEAVVDSDENTEDEDNVQYTETSSSTGDEDDL